MTETEFALNLEFRIRSPSLNSCKIGEVFAMKTIASILVLLVALHSHCGVQCLGAESMPAQPPCHQHAGNPQTPVQNNPCGQAQTLESRIGPISKCVFDCTALEPVTFQPSSFDIAFAITAKTETSSVTVFPSQTHSAILRI